MARKSIREKIEEREPSDSSKQKILTAAMELFFEQGYENTTTRQIIQKAGVLNGSLYYFFKGKENILESIAMTQLNKAFMYADERLKVSDDPMTVLLFPLAIELYTAEHSRKAADFLFCAHSSLEITDKIITMIHRWVLAHYPEYADKMSTEEFKLNFLVVTSLQRSFLGEYSRGNTWIQYRKCLTTLMKSVSVLFNIPVSNFNMMVDTICKKVETEKIIVGSEYLKIEIHDIDDSKKMDQLNLSSEAR